jgi:hypothetical protein
VTTPPASCVRARARTAVPPVTSSGGTGDLFHGERASMAADPGAPFSIPDRLVADETRADGRNEAEGGEGRYHPRDGEQPKQQDRRDRSSPSEASADPQTQRDVREHVQRDPAAKTERWDDQERIVDVVEGGLQSEREQDDARDHRQVQVRVRVSRGVGAIIRCGEVLAVGSRQGFGDRRRVSHGVLEHDHHRTVST